MKHNYHTQRILKGLMGFPGGSDGKESACNAGDLGLIPGLGRFPGGGLDNPLQYSWLENPRNKGASWAAVHGVTESDTAERLNTWKVNELAIILASLDFEHQKVGAPIFTI